MKQNTTMKQMKLQVVLRTQLASDARKWTAAAAFKVVEVWNAQSTVVTRIVVRGTWRSVVLRHMHSGQRLWQQILHQLLIFEKLCCETIHIITHMHQFVHGFAKIRSGRYKSPIQTLISSPYYRIAIIIFFKFIITIIVI